MKLLDVEERERRGTDKQKENGKEKKEEIKLKLSEKEMKE